MINKYVIVLILAGLMTSVSPGSFFTSLYAQNVAEKSTNHESAADYVWDVTKEIPVKLNGSSISVSSAGVTVKGSVITITAAGTYSFSGTLTNGQIIVNTKDKETVRLILNGVIIHCSNSAPVYIQDSKKTVIVLAENTKNQITDGNTYVTVDNEPNAAIFSKSNLSFYGKGSLAVTAGFKDGIGGKDGIIIKSGSISVTSADDGIRGKNYLIIREGLITVNSKGDALSSDNDVDAGRGFVLVNAGTINLTSGGDGIQGVTDVKINGGTFNIKTGTGKSTAVPGDVVSKKGLKAADSLIIKKGTFVINTTDDALHSSAKMRIDNGTFTLTTGDDGIHADSALVINGGTINILQSYEGIESMSVTVNGGSIRLLSADDGLNAASGSSGGGFQGGGPGGFGGGRGGRGGGGFGGGGNNFLYINGGYIALKASGDGMDVNGSVVMTGGTLIVDGPTERMNGPLDYDGGFRITGGTVVASGSAGMAMIPDGSSTQCSVLVIFNTSLEPGTIVHIRTAAGKEVFTVTNSKYFQSVAFSSPEFKIGTKYDVYVSGKSTGTLTDGIYKGGTYTPGTKSTSFTITGVSTVVNY